MTPGLLIIADDGKVDLLNAEAVRLLGVERALLIGRDWQVVFNYVDATGRQILDRAVSEISAGKRLSANGFLRLPNHPEAPETGRSLRWSISQLFDRNSKPQICINLRDMSWRAQSTAIGVNLHLGQDVFEHSVDGMFRTSLDGHYIEVNPALAKMYGFATPAEMLSRTWDLNTQLYVDHDRRAEFVRALAEAGSVKDFESEIYRADGTRIWISEYARTVLDGGGRPIYYEGSVVDITSRRLAETRLRESEQRYRLLVEAMNLVPWEADSGVRCYIYVGPQASALLGFDWDEWLQDGFWAANVHPEDRHWVQVIREESLEKRGGCEVEYRMIRADGRTVWVRDMMKAIEVNGRKILSGCMLDVTYRRFTETSLEKSQYFVGQVVNSLPVILYVYDLETRRCVFVSGKVGEILGYSANALRDMDPLFWIALGHPEEITLREEHFQKLAASSVDDVVTSEFRMRAADGHWVWLRSRDSRFLPSHGAESAQVVGSAMDITVHHIAVEEIVNNELLFRKLAETTRVVPFEYEVRSKRFSYVGPQASALFGYPLNRWFGENFWESIIHPEDYVSKLTFVHDESEQSLGGSQNAEIRLRNASGHYLWIAQVSRRMVDEDKQVRVRGFLLDVSESKKREEELNHSRQLLRQLSLKDQEAREEERILIAREIHDELGQILTLFQIELQWLEGRVRKVAPQEQEIALKLTEMRGWASETLNTVRHLLVRLRPPILDELGLAAAIQWQADEFARRTGIHCDGQIESFECHDQGCVTTVFRVFQEILTNVAKHAKATKISVTLRRDSSSLKLKVTDNGQGFRMDGDRRHDSFGLLGMRERVEAQKGAFQITSSPGKGTSVKIRIPLAFGE